MYKIIIGTTPSSFHNHKKYYPVLVSLSIHVVSTHRRKTKMKNWQKNEDTFYYGTNVVISFAIIYLKIFDMPQKQKLNICEACVWGKTMDYVYRFYTVLYSKMVQKFDLAQSSNKQTTTTTIHNRTNKQNIKLTSFRIIVPS